MSKIIDKILSEVSLDSRIKDGIFRIENDGHMNALYDYLRKKGIDEETVISFSNKILEGKYPERQAYNAKGILVTFPTPEYKADAIKRGTHFEKDPTRKTSNVFSTTPDATKEPEKKPTTSTSEKSKDEPKTNLPISQATTSNIGGEKDFPPEQDVQAKTTAAPQQTPQSSPQANNIAKGTNELPTAPPPKSDAEKEADKKAIKVMLKGDDYMLEQIIEYLEFNAPSYIMEAIRKRLI